MILVSENVRYANGQVAAFQPVTVVLRGTNSPVDLFSDNIGTQLSNPATTDRTGNISFYLAAGSYDILSNGGRIPFDVLSEAAGGGFDFVQLAPLQTWTINHNLGYRPAVDVFSVGGVKMLAEVVHTSVNQTVVSFLQGTAGSARLA